MVPDVYCMFTVSWQFNFRRIIHPAVFLLPDIDNVAHVREAFALHVPALESLQFGQHLVGHLHKIAVPLTVYDAEGMHVRVLAQVFQFRLLVVGVHRNGYGTYLGTSIEEGQPVGHVFRPDAHMCAMGHPDGKQPLCHVVHTAVELAPRKAQVAVGINQIFFVRRHGSPVFQPVAQCPF